MQFAPSFSWIRLTLALMVGRMVTNAAPCDVSLPTQDYITCALRACNAGDCSNNRAFNVSGVTNGAEVISNIARDAAWDLLPTYAAKQITYDAHVGNCGGGSSGGKQVYCDAKMSLARGPSDVGDGQYFFTTTPCSTVPFVDDNYVSIHYEFQHRFSAHTLLKPKTANAESISFQLCLGNSYANPTSACYMQARSTRVDQSPLWIERGRSSREYQSYDVYVGTEKCTFPTWPGGQTRPSSIPIPQATLDYVIGVGAYTGVDIVQCLAGYRVNTTDTGTVVCEPDQHNQCVSPDESTRQPAKSAVCAGHGSCNLDWTLTNKNRDLFGTNDKWLSCTCDAGYTSPDDGGAYCSQ